MQRLSDTARDRLSARIDWLASLDAPVIDMDTHISDPAVRSAVHRRKAETEGYFHGRPLSAGELVDEMDGAGVDAALTWQNPAATDYSDDPDENFRRLTHANDYVAGAAAHYPTRLIPAGWSDPVALGLENALRLVEHCVNELGFAIVKFNPAQNAYPITSPDVLTCVDRVVELGAVPAFHFGADTPFTPAEGLGAVAARHPDRGIIGVHMGGGGASYPDQETTCIPARALLLSHPNIVFPFSAVRDTHIESAIIAAARAGAPVWHRIMAASDAPYGRMTWNFGGFRAMLADLARREGTGVTADVTAGILGRNAAQFLLAAHRDLLNARAGVPA